MDWGLKSVVKHREKGEGLAICLAKSLENTLLPYGFAYGRRGDPGVVEWPWGAVLGARWPFLIPTKRHFVKVWRLKMSMRGSQMDTGVN